MPTIFLNLKHHSWQKLTVLLKLLVVIRLSAVHRWALQIPLFWMACVAISAIVIADNQWLAWICPGILIGYCVWIRRPFFVFGIMLTGIVFGIWHLSTLKRIQRFPLANQQMDVTGKGWINSDSGQKSPNRYQGTFALDKLSVGGRSIPLPDTHYVVLSIEKTNSRAITYGSEITFTGRLKPIETAATPGAFDPAKYYFRSARAIAQLEITPGDHHTVSPTAHRGFWLRRQAIAARKWMETGLGYGVAQSDQPLNHTILAMVLGSREKSPEQIEEWFRLSGTLHIFAVSGLHVGVVALLLWWMLKWTGVSRVSSVYILIPAILFYATLTGLRPSSCRAALMLAIFLIGFSLRLRSSPLNALGLAALILLALDTQQVFLPGFQLSFSVVFSLILVGSFLSKCLHEPFRVDDFIPRNRVNYWRIVLDKALKFVSAATAISVASWVGSLLLMDTHFNGITPIGLVANIFMVPIAGAIVTIAGIAIACYGIKLTFATIILNQINLALITILTGLAQFFATIPGGHIHTGNNSKKPCLASLNIVGIGGEMAGLMTIGDSNWLIDTGGNRTFSTQLLPLIRTRGINQIDGLVLSHSDAGHIGKAPYILQQIPPRLVIESKLPNKARVYPKINQLIERKKINRLQVQSPQRIKINDQLFFEVIYPTESEPPTGIADDRCLILMLHSDHWRILFTFDSGFLVEKNLLALNKNLRADIWIRGQHSQAGSNSIEFLNLITPKAIITTEADFPSHERLNQHWVKTVQQEKIALYTLKQAGSIQINLSERELDIQSYLQETVLKLRK